MPKPPKSPLERSTSGHSRRPSGPRRTSSSDKKSSAISSSSKHKPKAASSHATNPQGSIMSNSPANTPADEGDSPSQSLPLTSRDEKKTVEVEDSTDSETSIEDQRYEGQPTSAEPFGTSSIDVASKLEKLRNAVNIQRAKAMERQIQRDNNPKEQLSAKSRISPIDEENVIAPSLSASFLSGPSTGQETTSTESAGTVRGIFSPGIAARTPSYPFPSMQSYRRTSLGGHKPFTALSPTVAPENYHPSTARHPIDRVMSGSVTPASAMSFLPSETHIVGDDLEFPVPNVYDLALQLTAEPGLEAWWTTTATIMRDAFKAERVTLAVPSDSTDIENVPWGQKATFNTVENDELSLTYLPRGSSLIPSSGDANDALMEDVGDDDLSSSVLFQPRSERPELLSRHSFTNIEDTRRDPFAHGEPQSVSTSQRGTLSRSKSYLAPRTKQTPQTTSSHKTKFNMSGVEENTASGQESRGSVADWENMEPLARTQEGRVFSVLQALDYEADPLLDSSGVIRVLERGKVIALTRDYPYVDVQEDELSGGTSSSQMSSLVEKDASDTLTKGRQTVSAAKTSTMRSGSSKTSERSGRSTTTNEQAKSKSIGSTGRDHLHAAFQRYEEYEQAPLSPWSQSPAPSPAIRAEPDENPFFTEAAVDEESFNPTRTPQDYSSQRPVEAIGVDRSCTVLHVPLYHPLLSKPVQAFRLDTAALKSRSTARGKATTASHSSGAGAKDSTPVEQKQIPIAILSVISPIIPYPPSLRHALTYLAPHLATSFSLCRHYSHLQNEISGLSRKRPNTIGFGSIVPHDGRIQLSSIGNERLQQSTGGSVTSPSDYSGLSRSTTGSPGGTPNWDPSTAGLTAERQSPSLSGSDTYFTSRIRPDLTRVNTSSSISVTGPRRSSNQTSPSDQRKDGRSHTDEKQPQHGASRSERRENIGPTTSKGDDGATTINAPKSAASQKQARAGHGDHEKPADSHDKVEHISSRQGVAPQPTPRRQAMRSVMSGQTGRIHTQLHSYGADITSTFPALPNVTGNTVRGSPTSAAYPRPESGAQGSIQMAPPSDRLKTMMLDSLPEHLFVALPQTGEIVWVNNRYLTYRGQNLEELYENPWGSIHPDERERFLKAWTHALNTGEQLSMQMRIRRFDGTYRWFYNRAVAGRDTRGVIVQWYGSYMDIHDQHIAEVKAARQEEIEASEAKHRMLANLIPQIIFSATEDEGVTFANEQWLSYTGQTYNDALGLGFMDFIHPEDLAKCRIPLGRTPGPTDLKTSQIPEHHSMTRDSSHLSSSGVSSVTSTQSDMSRTPTESTTKQNPPKASKVRGKHEALSRQNSSSSESMYELPSADLSELTKSGVVKVDIDSNGRKSYTTEVRLRNKAGEYRWHLVRCVEIDNINFGSGDGSWFGACTDINDHKILEKKLKEAMDLKTQFLSNMSHEIRTPLIGISGMITFLHDTILNDEQLDYTNTIHSSAQSLLSIINDILDLSKAEAGKMKLSFNWLSPSDAIEKVNDLVATTVISKGIELNYMVDEDVPLNVKGDEFRLRQVLLNTIGNAIKFTSEGEVFCHCKVSRDPQYEVKEHEIMLEFSVVDTGPGFTKEQADLIFKPFSQISDHNTANYGGSGLGLVISQQLVELHGGHMSCSAVPGEGSKFTFTAKFGLPTETDVPGPLMTPMLPSTPFSVPSLSQAAAKALNASVSQLGSTLRAVTSPHVRSPEIESSIMSPSLTSSASTDPSLRSARTHVTERSSASSVNPGLMQFNEAAKAGVDNSFQMKLSLPEKLSSTARPNTESGSASETSVPLLELKTVRPPMYSILVVCPQHYGLLATVHHIEKTIPSDVPHQITPVHNVDEAQKLLGGDDPVIFTHVVLNLNMAEYVVFLIEQILTSVSSPRTAVVVLSDSVQRHSIMKLAPDYDYEQLAKDNRLTFLFRPVKPSKFATFFDPGKERDFSTDRNRSAAQEQIADQKQTYLGIEKRIGNRGHKVLLVEDNLVNQKVLLKFLSKIGISVELAKDGLDCTEKVFSRPHEFFSLVLCDLHMPRKDGYQACKDIREWERAHRWPYMPIIALSANVMSDVLDKCVAAGFNSYVTKPVDFKALSAAMTELLDPVDPNRPHELMRPRT